MPVNHNNKEEEVLFSRDEQLAYEASEVQVLLKKEIVKAAFAATETQIKEEWEKAENPLAREMCWHEFHAFRKVIRKLRALSERHTLQIAKE